MSASAVIDELAARTELGYSLDQKFYCDDAVFAADLEQVIGRKWLVAGHVDRVRNKGDYFLFKVANESIIIVRSDESTINAFYNVCRHRGSLICTKPQGRVARLTCGYHAWSYGLDGALLAARLMPEDFSKKDNGLQRCHIRVFHGFIFVNLSDQPPVDFDAAFGDLAPYLDFHGFADAKIAYSQSYPTTANWKLIVENFVECYHCAPSHPEFCSMHPPEALIAFGAGPRFGPARRGGKIPSGRQSLGGPGGQARAPHRHGGRWARLLAPAAAAAEDHTRRLRDRDPGRAAGVQAHGQAAGLRPGADVPVVQPLHPAGRDQ